MLPPSFTPPPEPIKPPEDEDKSGPTDIGHVMGNITLAHTHGTFISSESLLLHLLTKELQFIRCQEIWKHWQIITTNPIFHDSLDSLYLSSSIQMQIHTTLIFIPQSPAKSLFSTQPWQLSMPQAMTLVFMGCIANIFIQLPHGVEGGLVMILRW